jgi:hypothetical protein
MKAVTPAKVWRAIMDSFAGVDLVHGVNDVPGRAILVEHLLGGGLGFFVDLSLVFFFVVFLGLGCVC